nr:hypothetical protein [uncultured Undibacterium sp.]
MCNSNNSLIDDFFAIESQNQHSYLMTRVLIEQICALRSETHLTATLSHALTEIIFDEIKRFSNKSNKELEAVLFGSLTSKNGAGHEGRIWRRYRNGKKGISGEIARRILGTALAEDLLDIGGACILWYHVDVCDAVYRTIRNFKPNRRSLVFSAETALKLQKASLGEYQVVFESNRHRFSAFSKGYPELEAKAEAALASLAAFTMLSRAETPEEIASRDISDLNFARLMDQ